MKKIILVSFLLTAGNIWADQSKKQTTVVTSETKEMPLKSEEKKEAKAQEGRKKKAEMCHECGKPETECDCEGHK